MRRPSRLAAGVVAVVGVAALALAAVDRPGDDRAVETPGDDLPPALEDDPTVATGTVAPTTPGGGNPGTAPPTAPPSAEGATTTTGSTSPSTTTPTTTSTTTASGATPAVAVRRGSTPAPVVALTFDAGSDTGHAGAVLDTLASNGIGATFGLTGRWAEANPALVRRMVAEGHLVVNHSYDHPSFTGFSTGRPPLSRDQRLDQLARADAAIRAAAGVTSVPWFRPPYGDEDASVRSDVAAAGYRYELLWTVDSLGWQGLDADAVVQRCLDAAAPGVVYLFHVGAASADAAALQQVIDGLAGRGYGFATADDMVESR